MANQVNGMVIAVSQVKTVASSDPSKAPLQKREIFIDCTRHDTYTGERSQYENKQVHEFTGKALEKCDAVLKTLQKGDVVSIFFDIQGIENTDKATGKKKYFNAIRCYDCKILRRAGQQPEYFSGHQPQGQAAAPQPAQQQAVVTQTAQSPFPPQGHDAPGSDKDLPF